MASHRHYGNNDEDSDPVDLSCDESGEISRRGLADTLTKLRGRVRNLEEDVARLNKIVLYGKDGDGEDSLVQRVGRFRHFGWIMLVGIPLIPIIAQVLQWLSQAK